MKYPITLLFRYDKYAYIDEFFDKNKDSLQFSISITNDTNEEETIRKLHSCWKPDLLNDYDHWLKFSFCIINKLGEKGYNIWNEISQQYAGYNASSNDRKWQDLLKTQQKSRDKKAGWKNYLIGQKKVISNYLMNCSHHFVLIGQD